MQLVGAENTDRVNEVNQVKAAAQARADALAQRDGSTLRQMLHPSFVWTSHRGETVDRERYLADKSGPASRWLGQTLDDVRVAVVGSTAVLVCVVIDQLQTADGSELFEMPMTQTWVREGEQWLCLAGHAGPRL
jgi:Domain of unknown function (DUF4440)